MRILILFDLPTQTKEDKKDYHRFVKFLNDDGYLMLQYSVYVRTCNGLDDVEKHEKRLLNNLPYKGSVQKIVLTEKQYESKDVLVGGVKYFEKKQIKGQLSLF